MEGNSEIYQQIVMRERASRKSAETLLEVKALELYQQKQRIETTRAKVDALNALLLNIMSASPDGIITCSPDLKIQSINGTATRQLRCTSADLKDKPVDLILPNFRRNLDKTSGQDFHFRNMVVKDAQGNQFPALVRGTQNRKFNRNQFVLFIHDITEEIKTAENLKLHQQQIDEARRLEAIGTLSAGIAHEINTPIQFIGDNLGFLSEALMKIHKSYDLYEKLKSKVEFNPDYAPLCKEVTVFNKKVGLKNIISDISESVIESIEGIEQVRDIVLLMKEFVHPGTGSQELVDINLILEGVVKISRNKIRDIADVRLCLDPNAPKISCRRGQIQQVILNMLMNAVDAIEDHGDGTGLIGLSTRHDVDYMHITISDTGPGVPEKLKEKIFDPFFTTKAVGKGTGQGLALAKDFIVGGHGGRLCFVDIDGYNTTFQISLPLRESNRCMNEQTNVA